MYIFFYIVLINIIINIEGGFLRGYIRYLHTLKNGVNYGHKSIFDP